MAALELQCGLDHGGCVWGGERVDLLDSFDSEMQEWEEQLQDMQRKIEELYKEVEARRGATETSPNSSTNTTNLDITLLPVNTANDYHVNSYNGLARSHNSDRELRPVGPCSGMSNDVRVGNGKAVNYSSDYTDGLVNLHGYGFRCPKSYQSNGGQDVTLDILNGYLSQGSNFTPSPSNPGPPETSSRGNQSVYCYQDSNKQWPLTGSIGCAAEVEEAENRKNKCLGTDEARVRHVSWKDPVCAKEPSPEKSVSKPPFKQRDGPPTPVLARATHFTEPPQQQDRKCPLVDRKCSGSPSVLRKFGAMLQENEGKTLVQDGTVTTVIPVESPKAQNTPVCQRKFSVSRASTHAESSQEHLRASAASSPRHNVVQSGEHWGSNYSTNHSYSHTKAPHRLEAGGNRKMGFQGNSGQWGSQAVDMQADYRMMERILGGCAGSQYQGKGNGADINQRKDNRGPFLDAMSGEQQYTSSQRSTQQVNHQPSSIPPRSFSRPARPANQRPPSRWASHAPTSKITTPSGPMHRPPSPARKAKQPFNNFSNFNNSVNLYTETVIM
ncbi:hypothetical protein AMEX_G16378 [Astyanax mexicanus]|uniref:SOGA 1/2-like coiled-coil domain-containing protein n=1 Tax=Astyanax mexicanus TaxID=7994 RepID=A0A8T2LEL9_ASTMX|nr:hypothetical protein AMEX_G16378 [Astyanax mexicanus]